MSGRHRVVLALCLALGVITTFALWQAAPQRRQKPVVDQDTVHTDRKTGEKYRIVGGVRRPLRDVSRREPISNETPSDPIERLVGQTPKIPLDANPMVASVAEAYRTKSHPERLSSSVLPTAFDAAKYAADPDAYLNIVEPGRVWQSAQPGSGVRPIQGVSPGFQQVPQMETVSLKVKVAPKAPVTFTSFDLGEFHNRLTSVTVAADEEGTAVARFTGTPGTYNRVNILAASPMTSGQIHFIVNVLVPGVQAPQPVQITSAAR